jgi:hypothetical protein
MFGFRSGLGFRGAQIDTTERAGTMVAAWSTHPDLAGALDTLVIARRRLTTAAIVLHYELVPPN